MHLFVCLIHYWLSSLFSNVQQYSFCWYLLSKSRNIALHVQWQMYIYMANIWCSLRHSESLFIITTPLFSSTHFSTLHPISETLFIMSHLKFSSVSRGRSAYYYSTLASWYPCLFHQTLLVNHAYRGLFLSQIVSYLCLTETYASSLIANPWLSEWIHNKMFYLHGKWWIFIAFF